MQRTPSACPDPELTRVLLREMPHSREAKGFRRHVRGCRDCGRLLERFCQEAAAAGGVPTTHPDALDFSCYLDTPEGDPARLPLSHHIADCDSCQERLRDLIDARRTAAAHPVTTYRPAAQGSVGLHTRRARVVQRWLPVAAGLLVVSAAGLRLSQRPSPPDGRPGATASNKTQEAAPQARPILADDIVSVFADGRVDISATPSVAKRLRTLFAGRIDGRVPLRLPGTHEVLRGTGMPTTAASKSDRPTLVSPVNRVVLGPEVRFEWFRPATSKAVSHTLEIQDTTDTADVRIFRQTSPGVRSVRLLHGHTYIWTVIAMDMSGVPLASARARLGVASAETARLVELTPGAHLVHGLLYESEGMYEEALAAYQRMRATGEGERVLSRLEMRARRGMERHRAPSSGVENG